MQGTTGAVKIGLQLEFEFDEQARGSPFRWEEIVATAERAEAVGFDSLWVPDHLLWMWDAWAMLAALAAITERVQIGTLVSCAAFRHPASIARIARTVDEISGGRLVLGLGAGWHEPEFRAYGFPYAQRVTRLEETLHVARSLMSGEEVSYTGTFGRVEACSLHPRGVPRSVPPILVGGTGRRILRLTARHADLWNADWRNRPNEIRPLLQALDEACVEVGRDPSSLVRTIGVMVDLPAGVARPAIYQSPPISGDPSLIADTINQFFELGISQVQVWLAPCSPEGVERFTPVLNRLK